MGQLGSIHWKKFERFLLSVGCKFAREYWKNGINRPLVIPRDKNLPPFVIMNNLRVLGISKAEFINWASKIKKK